MFLKFIFFILFTSFSFASFQEVKIGNIDSFYKDKISKAQLRVLINEIETLFESQLNMNVFDYSENGKDINIIYVPASLQEKRVLKTIKRLNEKRRKIEEFQLYFPPKKDKIKNMKKKFEINNKLLSKKVDSFNEYIRKINKRKNISKSEYEQIKKYEKKEKRNINLQLENLKKQRKYIKKEISKFNNKINVYNSLIQSYNTLNNHLEIMKKSFKKVKGMTFGIKEIQIKSYYKNGRKIEKRSEKNSMTKIDIYGFESLNELKAILAHEIGHLVGVPHLNTKNALMNPVMQKNQIKKLYLTKEDILNFKRYF